MHNRKRFSRVDALVDERVVGVAGFDINIVVDAVIFGIGHADFFAHVNVGGAAQHMDHGGQHGCGFHPVCCRVTEAVDGSRLVVVVEEERVPTVAFLHAQRPFVEGAFEVDGIEPHIAPFLPIEIVHFEVVEAEYHVELMVVGIGVLHAVLNACRRHFADGHRIRILAKTLGIQLLKVGVDVGTIGVHVAGVFTRCRGFQFRGLANDVDDIKTETVDSFGPPEVHDFHHLVAHFWVTPIQISLGGIIKVEIIVAGVAEGRPGGTTEF